MVARTQLANWMFILIYDFSCHWLGLRKAFSECVSAGFRILVCWSKKKKCCLSSSSFCSTPRRMCDVPTSGYIYAGKMEQELVQELQVWADCSSFSSIATVGKDYSLLRTAVDNICFF